MLFVRRFIRQVLPLSKGIKMSAVLPSEELFVHRDSDENNSTTYFEFTPENMLRLTAIMSNYPIGYERSALGAALDLAQRQYGWIPITAMHRIADILEIPRMRVYEFATFYTMYRRRFMGHYRIQVCSTTPCMLCGAEAILSAVEAEVKAREGEVSADGMFGVSIVECQGACANAPVVVVNDDFYEDVTPEGIRVILQQLRLGEIPPPGPQSGRFASEPITGLTSLLEQPPGPGFMLQEALLKE